MNSNSSNHKSQYNKLLLWLCFLSFFSVLNEMVLNVSFPDVANYFGKAPASINWINTSFMLSFSVGTAIYGKVSDYVGIKKLLLTGILLNCIGSIMGFIGHTSFPVLLLSRFIQGTGAAAFPALIMVVVAKYIPRESQGKAFGLIGSIVAMGEALGPSIGGMIAEYIHWSYLLILPLGTLISVPFLIKMLDHEPIKKGSFDFIGLVLMSLSIVTFMVFTTSYKLYFLGISFVIFIIFIKHIKKVDEPFIEPKLGENRSFMVGIVCGGLFFGTVAGFISMVPYMMRDLYQLSTLAIGNGIIFPGAVSLIIFGYFGGILVDKKGPIFVLTIGAMLLSISFLLAALFVETTPFLITILIIFIFGGLSFTKTVISTIVSSSLTTKESGSGMSLLNFTSFLSEGLGIAVVGGLLSVDILNKKIIPINVSSQSYLYSNMLLIFSIIIIFSWLITIKVYSEPKIK